MERVISPARWAEFAGFADLVAALGASDTRVVGGAVRDTLLGRSVTDVDLATRHLPDEASARIRAAGLKAVPTGLKHGTVTAVLASGRPVEVTTLRRDVETDGRHATVAFTDDWREDAGRRDFTVNALYADALTGEVFDYHDGLGDLADGRIRFIGDPYRRIAEDHLRILRFFRFVARFGSEPDAVGLEACAARANDLMALSRERIAGELLRLLVAPAAVPVVALMVERGIFRPVLPEVADPAALSELVQREAVAEIAADPIRRLAALLPDDPAIAETIAARLKLSNAQRTRLVAARTWRTGSVYEDAYRNGRDAAIDRALLRFEAFDAYLAARHASKWDIPRLPITGGALVGRGLSRGPEVAATLRRVEDAWIAEGFPDAGRVGELADEAVARALGA